MERFVVLMLRVLFGNTWHHSFLIHTWHYCAACLTLPFISVSSPLLAEKGRALLSYDSKSGPIN